MNCAKPLPRPGFADFRPQQLWSRTGLACHQSFSRFFCARSSTG